LLLISIALLLPHYRVALCGGSKMMRLAVFHLCALAGAQARRGFRSATTGNQASGGARD
jgi:hypothetical protein